MLQPNGGEVFLAGSDTIITWEGVSTDEPETIEYRTDDNQPWIKLTDTAKGLSYKFHVPKIASDKYLARVTAKVETEYEYCEIQICNQTWMCKNLNIDTYRNGDPIPEVTDSAPWVNLKTGAWCYYKNDPANGAIYGKLYNWHAVNDPRGLAPDGYHIPTDAEWTELENCLGGSVVAGGKLKSTGTIEGGDGLWNISNNATNESGFSGLPGGARGYVGVYTAIGRRGFWWSSTVYYNTLILSRYLQNDSFDINNTNYPDYFGLSVRCVKDK